MVRWLIFSMAACRIQTFGDTAIAGIGELSDFAGDAKLQASSETVRVVAGVAQGVHQRKSLVIRAYQKIRGS